MSEQRCAAKFVGYHPVTVSQRLKSGVLVDLVLRCVVAVAVFQVIPVLIPRELSV
jgi:hypothetical protein